MVTAARLTYQDYLNTPGDERYELLDGELILVASPNMAHQDVVTNLGTRVSVFVREEETWESSTSLPPTSYSPTPRSFSQTYYSSPKSGSTSGPPPTSGARPT